MPIETPGQPTAAPGTLAGIPRREEDRSDILGAVSAESEAKRIAEFHRKSLMARRLRDLTAEKYLLHLDGEGDMQFADLLDGQRIAIFDYGDQVLAQENLLRPIINNAVAYHTTQEFRFVAIPKQDRKSRESAVYDTALANYHARQARLNQVFAAAMNTAMCYGSCPVHAFWRDDLSYDPYEPLLQPEWQGFTPRKGIIDAWVGDPWDTVYDAGARAGSIHRMQYGRTLPADLVRQAFPEFAHVLEGSDRMPSAARFQRIQRLWSRVGLQVHGSAAILPGELREELIALIFEEVAPGQLPDWPRGRLSVVALVGSASTDRNEGVGTGTPLLLHQGELPGGCLSAALVYSEPRSDDVLRKPFIADLDDLQVRLNITLSLEAELIRRTVRAPLVDPGMLNQDTMFWDDYAIVEADPSARQAPFFLQVPQSPYRLLERHANAIRQAMFTIGGYQAASRGEATSAESGKAIIALQRADDTVHGPTNQRFRESVVEYMGIAWRLFKQYGDVPWVIDVLGDDRGFYAESYLDRTKISETPPSYRLVSGFGSTPETKAQQLFTLVQTRGADGKVLLTTDEFKKAFPDPSVYETKETSQIVKERRAKVINQRLRDVAAGLEEAFGDQAWRLLEMAHGALLAEFELLPDDDDGMHIEYLSRITQDVQESPLARQLARMRQALYMQRQMQRLLLMQGLPLPPAEAPGPRGPGAALPAPDRPGGTPNSEAMEQASERSPDSAAMIGG